MFNLQTRKGFLAVPVVLQALAVTIVGAVLGAASLAIPPLWIIAALLGTIVFVLALGRVELFLLGLLIGLSTIIPFETLPAISIGPGRLFLTDLLLATPFVVLTIRWVLDPHFKMIRSPLDIPVVLFFAIAVIATTIGLFRSLPPTISMSDIVQSPPEIITKIIPMIRLLAYYLLLLATVNLVRNEKQLSLLVRGMIFLGTLNAVFMIIQFLFPSVPLLSAEGRVESLVTEGVVYQDVTRVINTTTEALMIIAFITKTTMILVRESWKPKPLDWGQWTMLLLAQVITFKRSLWIGVIVSVVILLLIARKAGRLRLLWASLAGLLILGVALVAANSKPDLRASQVLLASGQRASSVFERKNYESDSSFGFRVVEADYAFQRLNEHPLLGIGYGQDYRPLTLLLDSEERDLRGYIHNGHLYILTKSGLLGYLPLLWFSLAFVTRGLRNWRRVRDPRMSSIVIGFTLSYFVALVISTVSPIFLEPYWAPVIALMMGTNEVIYRLYLPSGPRQTAAPPAAQEMAA